MTPAEETGFSPNVQELSDLLRGANDLPLARLAFPGMVVDLQVLGSWLWAILRREKAGGIALRLAQTSGAVGCELRQSDKSTIHLDLRSSLGRHVIELSTDEAEFALLRATVRFTPGFPVRLPVSPRDLYPLDAHDDPLGAQGRILARQRGPGSGLLYLRFDRPEFGTLLYFQNFTALNAFYLATGTTPVDSVGGAWPELGHRLPSPGEDQARALPAGKEVVISDTLLAFRHDALDDERLAARHFLQLLAAIYNAIDHPGTTYRDWAVRAERTLKDLRQSPKATVRHYGHPYVHPYTAAEYPDVMVQASIVAALHDWGEWLGEHDPLEAELKAGLSRFYDSDLKTLRRYLPNVGEDKDADAVDSWYLYHPLLNLGVLALAGDDTSKGLFFASLDYGIKAAHHFGYCWPVQYKVTDFSVITATAEADGRGQTDVGGIYAWVMLQAFELTHEARYLEEARLAIDKAIGLEFDLNYQANLTAWGAAACMRLWRITNEAAYEQQSYVYLASFFHNCEIWESEIGHAASYSNFLGATCLQDAPYMAMYECFEAFAAFKHLLEDSGPTLQPAARLLVSEYCRYALYRAWFYYPDALPAEAIAEEQRESNGHVDRKLSFPLEDLYADGQSAGQVGQEVYGAGAAFVFASRAFHTVEGAPFRIYCDHFVRAIERTADEAVSLTVAGGETSDAHLSIVRVKRRKLPTVEITTAGGEALDPLSACADRIDFCVPANGRLILKWNTK